MRFQLVSLLIVLCATLSCGIEVEARQRSITITNECSDITGFIRSQLSGLKRTDTVAVSFSAGDFHINGSINILPNVTIKGAGKDSTRILFNNTRSYNGDYLFCFNGKKGQNTSVEISDLTLEMEPHDTLWYDITKPMYVLKFLHVDGVKIHDFSSTLHNAIATTMDFRVCSNVDIHHCDLVNNNNCEAGGIIWMRRNNRNISITHNRFTKYGNDEIFAFWDGGDDESEKFTPYGIKDSILIADNEINYTPCPRAKPMTLDVLFAIYNDALIDRHTAISYTNISIEKNKFFINAPVWILFSLKFNKNDNHDNIRFVGNHIYYSQNCAYRGHAHNDFLIIDNTSKPSAIVINNNQITTDCRFTDKNGKNGNYCVLSDGSNIVMRDNVIKAQSGIDNNDKFGLTLLWAQLQGGTFTLENNEATGLYKLASLSGGSHVDNAKITATGNSFSGDTRIYCRNLERAHLDFTCNTFNSTTFEMFLQEYPASGTVKFNDNIVNAGRDCHLFTCYDTNVPYRFELIEVSGNRISGTSQTFWLKDVPDATQRKVANNR